MTIDDPDVLARAVPALHRAGAWDAALALLAARQDPDAAALRAQILVDRLWWRLDDPAPAKAAVDALAPTSVPARYLHARLAYQRIVFGIGVQDDDVDTAVSGFSATASDETLGGWGTFWLGVVADNLHDDPDTAGSRYREAWHRAAADGDLLLESYVLRHLGAHAQEQGVDGEASLRQSLHLRASLGARPETAAAQVTLAGALDPGPERDALRRAAGATAAELGLTWLRRELSASATDSRPERSHP